MGKILRAVTNDGTAKISVITAPDMVERAREIHHLVINKNIIFCASNDTLYFKIAFSENIRNFTQY